MLAAAVGGWWAQAKGRRDRTCRFPGCDRPAQFCDIDHTVPYPYGFTHPSNLKCLCAENII